MTTTTTRRLFLFPLLCLALALASASEVVELNDKNFEHLTQASTGATTGDWFVAFSAPWCGHCKHLEPTWQEIAVELKGEVNIAKVDATANSGLATRFGIRAFPILKFFHQGKLYDYRGPRDAEHLLEFAKGGFKDLPSIPVPVPPTFTDIIKSQVAEATEGVLALYYQIMREVKLVVNGEKSVDAPFLIMMAMIVIFFGLLVLTVAAIFTGGAGEEERKVATEKKRK